MTRPSLRLEQRPQGLDGFEGMLPSPQFVGGKLRRAPAEALPPRLICGIRLMNGHPAQQLGPRQRLEKRTTPGLLRREKDDGGNPQRDTREPVAGPPQVDLELRDSAAPPDDRRIANGRGVLRPAQPAQRFGLNVQKIRHTGGKHSSGRDEYAVLRQDLEALQHALQGQRGFSGTGGAHQQDPAAGSADAGGVQRHQTLRSGARVNTANSISS